MKRAFVALSVLVGSLAAAQKPQTPPPEEGPIADPNVPDPQLQREESTARTSAYRYEKRDYPVEIVRRPLTLADSQTEISLDMPFVSHDGHPTLTQILRAAFGVTRDFQAGLTYAIGVERLNKEGTEKGFDAGKAVSVDAAYTIIPAYLAAQARVAFYIDPDVFGLSLILGVPFKFTLSDEWAIYGGADLVRIKLKSLPVEVSRPDDNISAAAFVKDGGGVASSGALSATVTTAYQAKRNLAVWGSVGFGWPDFDSDRQTFAIYAGATVSPRHFWDLGARIGMESVADAAETFSIGVFTAVRL